MTPYETLKVKKDATQQEIKKAYIKKAKSHHPDKSGGDTEEMQAVNKAYAVLKNPESREHYDKYGEEKTVNNDEVRLTQIICEIVSGLISADPKNIKVQLERLSSDWTLSYTQGKNKAVSELEQIINFKKRISKNPENDIVNGFIEGKINTANLNILHIEQDYKLRTKALKFLINEYEFVNKDSESVVSYFTISFTGA